MTKQDHDKFWKRRAREAARAGMAWEFARCNEGAHSSGWDGMEFEPLVPMDGWHGGDY